MGSIAFGTGGAFAHHGRLSWLRTLFAPAPPRKSYRFETIMSALDDLKAAVQQNTEAVDRATAMLANPGVDPAAVATLTGMILTDSKRLADAVAQASVAGASS